MILNFILTEVTHITTNETILAVAGIIAMCILGLYAIKHMDD